MRAACLLAAIVALAGGTAIAQDAPAMPTLPDETGITEPQPQVDPARLATLQTELEALARDLNRMRSDLMRSGPEGFARAGGDAALDRITAMEARVTALTAAVEEKRNAQTLALKQAEKRMADLEFRLCELEPTCNLGDLTGAPDATPNGAGDGSGPGLGSGLASGLGATTRGTDRDRHGNAASAAEQEAFDQARAMFDKGDYAQAAQLFAALARRHAGGALTAQALYLQGVALDRDHQTDPAAEAWLTAYAADPKGDFAAKSLLGVARALHQRGDTDAACLTLLDIPARFANSPEATEADSLIEAQNCLAASKPADDGTATPSDDPEGEAGFYAPNGG